MAAQVQLRQWKDADLDGFAAMNADAEVMRYFLAPLSAEESKQALQRFRQAIDAQGWGLWAVEVDGVFAGFTGLSVPPFTAHFTPCVEIGWRFRPEYWGRGIAFAAAQQAEHHAFKVLGLDSLVSFTTAANLRSRRLMERLGFARDCSEDFWHPKIAAGHPLGRHVLYRKVNPNKVDSGNSSYGGCRVTDASRSSPPHTKLATSEMELAQQTVVGIQKRTS